MLKLETTLLYYPVKKPLHYFKESSKCLHLQQHGSFPSGLDSFKTLDNH